MYLLNVEYCFKHLDLSVSILDKHNHLLVEFISTRERQKINRKNKFSACYLALCNMQKIKQRLGLRNMCMCVKAILIIAMECVTKVMPFEIGLEGGEGLSCLGRFLGTGSSKGTNADVGKCTPSTSCSSFGIFNDPLAYLVFLLPLFVYNIICTFFIHAKISSL